MPEARIEQVQHCVFRAADIKVYRHPVLFLRTVKYLIVITRVNESQVVPARSGPLGHGVGLPLAAAAVAVSDPQPVGGIREWRLTAVTRFIDLKLGKSEWQILFVKQADGAVLPVDDREWLTPVTLTAEEPVAQLVVDPVNTKVPAFEPFCDGGDSLLYVQSVKADIQLFIG